MFNGVTTFVRRLDDVDERFDDADEDADADDVELTSLRAELTVTSFSVFTLAAAAPASVTCLPEVAVTSVLLVSEVIVGAASACRLLSSASVAPSCPSLSVGFAWLAASELLLELSAPPALSKPRLAYAGGKSFVSSFST